MFAYWYFYYNNNIMRHAITHIHTSSYSDFDLSTNAYIVETSFRKI